MSEKQHKNPNQLSGYKAYFDKSYDFLLNEELRHSRPYTAKRLAYLRLRMYANLFTRFLKRNGYILDKCAYCGNTENLQLDHIIPIIKGGKNIEENIQVLCRKCNIKKRAN